MAFGNIDLAEFAAFAERLAETARRQTLPRFRQKTAVFNKAGLWYDPVTDADREAERAQRTTIEKIYPGHGVIGEEFGLSGGDSNWRWVLDPVDGTRAFVCGIATWATLIALEFDNEPVLGLIDQPFTDERWLAFDGRCSYHRSGETITAKTSGLTDLSKARISTTDPRPTAYFTESEAKAFARVARATRLARFSLDAYAYGLLAVGELDLVMEAGLEHHDYAALTPVVKNAGGVITNWRGEPLGTDERGEVIAAATEELHEAALNAING